LFDGRFLECSRAALCLWNSARQGSADGEFLPRTEHTANLSDEVRGTVFEITAEELIAADRYEVSEYTRVLATLKSGARAWIYVRA
jgi:hypothetical protein